MLAHVSRAYSKREWALRKINFRELKAMELCVKLKVPPRPGYRDSVVILVLVIAAVIIADRTGYVVPDVVMSVIMGAALTSIQALQPVPAIETRAGVRW